MIKKIFVGALIIFVAVVALRAFTVLARGDNEEGNNRGEDASNFNHDLKSNLKSNDDSNLRQLFEGKGAFSFGDFPKFLGHDWTSRNASVSINPNGRAVIVAGTVSAVNLPNLTLNVWGISFNILTTPSTTAQGVPGISTNAASTSGTSTVPTPASQIQVGDKVDVLGDVNPSTGVIQAVRLRDRSQAQATQTQIQQLLQQIEQLRAQLKGLLGF